MRILIIDDTNDSRDTICAMAEWLGHEVILAKNGMEAVRIAIDKHPELVLMDLMMPDSDGEQAAAALRKISSFVRLPIVMVTAYPDKAGSKPQVVWDAFLRKPVNLEDLTEIIDRFAR